MNVSLSLDKSYSEDVAIVVDVLRASTTMIVAMKNFNSIIPVRTREEAEKLALRYDAVVAGERGGATIEGFDAGNSPIQITAFHGNVLVITTSNGTRVIEGIKSKLLIGAFTNARSVAKKAMSMAENHIEVVMAGVNGNFAIEDFLGAGEIIKNLKKHDLDEMAVASYMAADDKNMVDYAVKNSKSARRLYELGFGNDVDFCLKRNIYESVPVYENGSIKGIDQNKKIEYM